MLIIVFLLTIIITPGCICGRGKIEGRLASSEGFGQSSSALSSREFKGDQEGLGQLSQALGLHGVEVELLRVGSGDNPDDWTVVRTTEPESDGSFSFGSVAGGDYAIRLKQPEFGGPAYAIDATEFTLGGGETVSLVLPLLSHVYPEPFGLDPYALVLDEDSGRVYGIDHGLVVIDIDREVVDVLHSRILFGGEQWAGAPPQAPYAIAHSKQRNEIIALTPRRIVRIDLSIFSDPGASEFIDYDDPEVRLALGDKVEWRFIPPDRNIETYGVFLGSSFSADDSILYVSISQSHNRQDHFPGLARALIIDVETLEIRRIVHGEAVAYHPFTDQLVFSGGQLVDATTVRDVGVTQVTPSLGVAPVPGKAEYVGAYSQIAADDREIPFIFVFDNEANVITEMRASEHLGIDWDPEPGQPAFDVTGEHFMLGTQSFRVLEDGGFEYIGVQVPPGPVFRQRVNCNQQRVFDPVNRYEIWFDCTESDHGVPSAIALIPADRTSIPVSVRVNSPQVLLEPKRGRALVFGAGAFLTLVHYADPSAADREEWTVLEVDERLGHDPGPSCGHSDPCEGNQICRAETDTSWTGRCMDNPRRPYLSFCAGITGIECDDGFTCELSNPTNPESLGFCAGSPNRNYEQHGPLCDDEGGCPAGFSCNSIDRCVPVGCLSDAECGDGRVCGMLYGIGRVCMSAGLLPDGELCFLSEECQSGFCLDTGLGSNDILEHDPPLLAVPVALCTTPCLKNSDCPDESTCVIGRSFFGGTGSIIDPPFPFCFHDDWLIDGYAPYGIGPSRPCDAECADHEICAGDKCWVGVHPPLFQAADEHSDSCREDYDCAVPAQCVSNPHNIDWSTCGFSCGRNWDCPWPVDCMAGRCLVSVSDQHDMPRYRCNEGQGCEDHEMCVDLGWSRLKCFDTDPCLSHADCPSGYECQGVCTAPCEYHRGHSVSGCADGYQCAFNRGAETVPYQFHGTCMPPLCDCPDSMGNELYCDQDSGACLIQTHCSTAPCDGTFGPDNPDPEIGETCCAPGNPCGLSGEEVCQCPPSCSWWNPSFCDCQPGDELYPCPDTGGVPDCPHGYTCLAGGSSLLGQWCLFQP